MKRVTSRKRAIFAGGLAVALSAVSSRAALYSIVNLGSSSGQADTFASSINFNGEVAINTPHVGAGTNPVLYTGGSSYQQIASLANALDVLQQVNNSGLAVGSSYDSSGNLQAVYASATSPALTQLSTLTAGGSGAAFGVSPSGVFGSATIVGNSLASGGQFQAVKWTGSGTITALTPSNISAWDLTGASEAYGINSAGTIIGQATAAGTENLDAFVTGIGGIFKDIAPAGSSQSLAESINSTGTVVGNWTDSSADQLGFVYSPATGLTTTLGVLGTPPGGAPYSSDAESINTSGQIVGYSLTTGGAQDAVLYNASGGALDLNALIPAGSGWSLTNAESINDAGDIVGTGTFDGSTEAFLLTPSGVSVPEPTCLTVLAGGGMMLLGRGRRSSRSA